MANIAGGVKIVGFVSPTDTTDTYAVIDPTYGVDGLRNVDDTTARDAITTERRRAGMFVGVKNGAFNDYYILNSGNTTWSQIQMVTGLTWDLGSYDLTLNTYGGGITKNLSILASDVTVTGGTYNSLNGVVTFSSNTTGSRTGLFYAGNWSASSAYTSSTVVTYTVNNLDYYAIANVSANPTPPSGDTANWRPISSRGVFTVSGFTSGYTNIYTTAATYNQTTASIALDFTDPSKNLSITGVTTIYGKDDSLKSNRVVDLNQKTLNFSSSTAPNSLTITTGGTVGIGVLSTGTTKLHVSAATDPIRIEGIGGSSDSNVLTIDTSGTVHTISVASLTSTVASNINTLYTSNGALNSNRVVDLNQKTLNFSSSTTPNSLTISTGGTVGIGVLSGTNALHVSATTNPVKIEGLTAVSATTKIVATDSNNQLVNFSGTNRSIPYFTTNGVITHSPTFTYNDSAARTLQIDDGDLNRSSSITFGGGRGNIICPSTVTSGLIFQAGLSTPFDQTKSFVFRNGPTNYFTLTSVGTTGSNSAHTATFNSTLSINNTGITTSNWGLSGIVTRVLANSYTDSTTATTTASETVASSFAVPTFAALTGKTYSALTNVYIAGAPIAGTNVTGLTTYALKVNTGTTYFGGDVTLSGISTGTTSQLLTRQSNGNVSFRNLGDVGVISSGNTTLYWYDENDTPPAVRPVASGTSSIAFGNGANALASDMFVFGSSAGLGATSATSSVFIGKQAGSGATEAANSLFIGEDAGLGATSARTSTFIGYKAGENSRSSQSSVFIGQYAGQSATTDNGGIVMIGHNAGQTTNNATYGVGIGYQAADSVTNGRQGVFIGFQAGQNSVYASSSVIIGGGAGKDITAITNTNAVFIGASAGDSAHRATGSVFIGDNSGYQANLSQSSVFVGDNAGYQANSSNAAVFVGYQAGSSAKSSDRSIFIGQQAGFGATGSSVSIAIGNVAGQNADGADASIMIGSQAGKDSTGMASSICIGTNTGSGTTSDRCIIIGNKAGSSGGFGNTNIIIGQNVTLSSGTVNSFNIGGVLFGSGCNSDDTSNSIFTAMTSGAVSIGINKPNDSAILDLTSTAKGFLPPRMTGTQAAAISSKAEGLMVYVTDTSGGFASKGWWGWTGGTLWTQLG